MKKLLTLAVFWILACSQMSCGYSTHSAMPGHFKTIYVEPFKNNVSYTTEGGRNLYLPQLELKVKNAIVSRYLFDGNLRISKKPEDADVILKGELVSYNRGGLRYSDDDNVEEYRVQIFVNVQLLDTKDQTAVWQENGMVGEATYFVTGAQASSETLAVDKAVTDLARRVIERTIQDW